ncbi:MAG TPA: hypothetical protein PK657_14085 [Legionella sp.]|nr:hypothetical protein [Legionella sp.]
MKTNKTLKNLKKLPVNLALAILTLGASLILGFLSFGGMYALLPILPLAIGAFVLSVAYEGEIYLQNMKGALNKLFRSEYIKHYLAREYLQNLPILQQDSPEFFHDYEKQLRLVHAMGHEHLTPISRKKKKQAEKTLKKMEQWFTQQLFPSDEPADITHSTYTTSLRQWLSLHDQAQWQLKLQKRRIIFNIAKVFSMLSALFMGLGTTYLSVEVFSVIPFLATIPFATWPLFIVPMAFIAGTAYGMLTFNAITDLINNNTLVTWYNKLKNDLKSGLTARNVFMTFTAVLLLGLAVVLTVCTAGTWWTIASNARPLFSWMNQMPRVIMNVLNPLITALSAFIFTVPNSAESFEIVDEAIKKKDATHSFYKSISDAFGRLRTAENWLQLFNPFRLILKLTLIPLRILLFLGHLMSIAVTADRMPGVPQIVSALFAMISEGFEDAHYFISQDSHEVSEENPAFSELVRMRMEQADDAHGNDIPTRILKLLFSPLYFLATLWDVSTSKLNRAEQTNSPRAVLSFNQAWNKQYGNAAEHEIPVNKDEQLPSVQWQIERTITQIDRYQKNHLDKATFSSHLAQQKKQSLEEFKTKLRTLNPEQVSLSELKNEIKHEQNQNAYNLHRLFGKSDPTRTSKFLEQLSSDITVPGI